MATKHDRHAVVEVICEQCGKQFQARKERIDQGLSRFCSKDCYNTHQTKDKSDRQHVGKENAKLTITCGKAGVYWLDPETLKRKTSTYAHWWWEMNKGPIPEGYKVHHKDGNPLNIEPDNFILATKKEIGQISGTKRVGTKLSDEAKEKISKAHAGKKLSKEHTQKLAEITKNRWKEGKFNLVHVGRYNHKWRGGSRKNYPVDFKRMKVIILDRDKNRCRICGKSPERLEVHHVDRHKENNAPGNLVTLCSRCHHQIHDSESSVDPIILAFQSMMK